MMAIAITALENSLDHAVTDEDRLKFITRLSDMTKVIGAPVGGSGGDGPPPVVLVPDTDDIETFNNLPQTGSAPTNDAPIPQAPHVTPGGSEMPPSISLQENEEESSSEIDPEFGYDDIEKELEELDAVYS